MPSNPTPFKTGTLALLAATAGLAALGASPASADHHKAAQMEAAPDIVATAMSTGVHETLVAAVKAADLVETLQGPGPLTVFAPTDTAFVKLPDGTVAELLEPENKGALTGILTYHAVAGAVTASDLAELIAQHGGTYTIPTISGETLSARLAGDTIVITDGAGRAAAVTNADVETSNGVIHVTDGVFLPG